MGTPSKGVTDVSDNVEYRGDSILMTSLIHYAKHLRDQYNSMLSKLDADAGVADTNYNALGAVLDVETYLKDGTANVGVVDIREISADQSCRDLYEGILHYMTDLRTKYNGTLTKLDADVGVTDTNYNALKAALDVAGFVKAGSSVTSGVPLVVGNISKAIMDDWQKKALEALLDWYSDFKTRYDATLTKLDNDATVTDTNYNSLGAAPTQSSYIVKS